MPVKISNTLLTKSPQTTVSAFPPN